MASSYFNIIVLIFSLLGPILLEAGGDFILPIKILKEVHSIEEAINATKYYLKQSQEFMFGNNICGNVYKKKKCEYMVQILKDRYMEMINKYINQDMFCRYVFNNCDNGQKLTLKSTYKCLSCQATVFLSNSKKVIIANDYIIDVYCSREGNLKDKYRCKNRITYYMGIYNNVKYGTKPLWFCMKYGKCTNSILDHNFVDFSSQEFPMITNLNSSHLSTNYGFQPNNNSIGYSHYRSRGRWTNPDDHFYHYHGHHYHHYPNPYIGWNLHFGLLPFFHIAI